MLDWDRGPLDEDDWSQLLLTVGVVCLALAVVVFVQTGTADGYELSIYGAYPWYFWGLALATIVLGQSIVVRSAIRETERWRGGFWLLMAANAVLLFLPLYRYSLYAEEDVLSFIGSVRYILTTGGVAPDNYYPAAHLLASATTFASDLGVETVIGVLPLLFSLFYIVTTYQLVSVLSDKRRETLFVVPVAALLLFNWEHLMFSPSVFGFFLLPFVLTQMLTRYQFESDRRTLLLMLAVIAIVFYHPLSSFFLVFVMVAIDGARYVADRTALSSETIVPKRSTNLVLACLTLVFTWHFSFESILGSTILVVESLLGGGDTSTLGSNIETISRTTPSVLDLASAGFYRYGIVAILVGATGVYGLTKAYRYAAGDREIRSFELAFAGVFVAFLALSIVAYTQDITIGFTRVSRYVRFTGAVFAGLAASLLLANRSTGLGRSAFVAALLAGLLVLAYLSVFTLYLSPITDDPNQQVPESELDGMQWLLTYQSEGLLVEELGTKQFRLHAAVTGGDPLPSSLRRRGVNYDSDPVPPDHFGYRNNTTLGASYPDARYLLLTTEGRQRYPAFYPDFRADWRFTPEDFDRLDRDTTTDKLYANGYFDVYHVRNETAGAV
jgi:hypothetical protein